MAERTAVTAVEPGVYVYMAGRTAVAGAWRGATARCVQCVQNRSVRVQCACGVRSARKPACRQTAARQQCERRMVYANQRQAQACVSACAARVRGARYAAATMA